MTRIPALKAVAFLILFRSDPQPVSSLKAEMDCHRHLVDLKLLEDEKRPADALKIAGYTDHRPDHQRLHYLQSIEGFGSAHLFPGWGWQYNSGLKEGAPTRRSGDLGFGDNEHDSLHCHLENSGSGKNVEFAEVHHKDFAGHLRRIALEDFVEEGNCFADTEVSIHSHLLTISSGEKPCEWDLPWLPMILLLMASPSTTTLTEGGSRMRRVVM